MIERFELENLEAMLKHFSGDKNTVKINDINSQVSMGEQIDLLESHVRSLQELKR